MRPPIALLVLACSLAAGFEVAAQPVELTFGEIVRRVRADNPLVGQARARLLDIEAQADEARLAWLGELSWTNDFSPIWVCQDADSQGEICNDDLEKDVYGPSGYRPHIRGRMYYALPLYTFGKIPAGKAAGEAGVGAAAADVEAARDEAVALAKQAFWGALAADDLLGVAGDGLDKLDEAKERLEEKLEADDDDVDERDVWRLVVYRAEVVGHVQSARSGRELALAGLRVAAGLEDGAEVRAVGALEPVDGEVGTLAATLERAYSGNAKVAAAAGVLRAREAQIELAQSRLWPDLIAGVAANYRVTPAETDCLPDLENRSNQCESANFWPIPVPFVELRWRLDLASRLSARGRAEAAAALARADLVALRAKLALDVEAAWRKVDESRALLDAHDEAVGSTHKWVVAVSMDHEMGVGTSSELMEALAAQAKTKVARMRTVHGLNVAVAELSRWVGEDLEKIQAVEASKQGEGGTE